MVMGGGGEEGENIWHWFVSRYVVTVRHMAMWLWLHTWPWLVSGHVAMLSRLTYDHG